MDLRSSPSKSGSRVIEYDLHGIVGVRLLNPSKEDAAAVANQLGTLQGELRSVPDIVIRFVKELVLPNMNYLGLDSAGFTDEGFYILRSNKSSIKARIPFDEIGGSCEIICESGLSAVPLLLAIVNLTFMKKNLIPLHASGFTFNGTGALVVGWAKGGKTEALLAFANHGAAYVGDEWVILSEDGRTMYGIPEPIRLWDWQLKYVPELKSMIPARKRAFFRSVRFLDEIHRLAKSSRLPIPFLHQAGEAMPALKRQLNIRVPPRKVFDGRFLASSRLDKIFFLLSREDQNIEIQPCSSEDIARRMANCNQFEQAPFFENYRAFKFAFPKSRNEFLENIPRLQETLLLNALKGKESFVVFHPYPVSFDLLYEKMVPYLTGQASVGATSCG